MCVSTLTQQLSLTVFYNVPFSDKKECREVCRRWSHSSSYRRETELIRSTITSWSTLNPCVVLKQQPLSKILRLQTGLPFVPNYTHIWDHQRMRKLSSADMVTLIKHEKTPSPHYELSSHPDYCAHTTETSGALAPATPIFTDSNWQCSIMWVTGRVSKDTRWSLSRENDIVEHTVLLIWRIHRCVAGVSLVAICRWC